jgi:dolichol-phosphate mannosyltransferase
LNLLICIPTYNEAENIEPFITAVFENCPPESNILVIDDNSPDGTAAIVEKIIEKNGERLHLIKRAGKMGGASAFLHAYEWGLAQGYDAMLAMDADFSHDPKYIPAIVEKTNGGADVVIGSRLVKGGGIENRTWIRNFISRSASLYCRIFLCCPIKDWTGGYNLWTRNALEKIDIKNIVTRGYSFQIELKYKAFRQGCIIVEVPITFPDRKFGISKMPKSFLVKALTDVIRIKFICIQSQSLKEAIKFGITGGLGTLTNLLIFFLCADILSMPVIPISIACFLIAGTQNYIVNHKWSFAWKMAKTKLSIGRWLIFLCSSLLGLAVNILAMTAVLQHFKPPFKFIAQACGILAGMFVNFFVSKFVVFRRKDAAKEN